MRINHGALILVLLLSVLPFRTINNAQPTRRSGSSSSSPPPPPENNKSHAISNDADKRYKIVSLILSSLVLISFCVVGIILPCFYESICFCVNKLCPRRNGLDQAVIETFPVFNYSAVQGLREESAPELVCAVCLNEFSDDETLRVLPCNHVFHPWCIDVWLAHSKTCPVCRARHSRHDSESKPDVRVRAPITDGSNQQAELSEGQGDAGADVVVNVVNEEESCENCRANYTSRLPEEVRRQLIPNSVKVFFSVLSQSDVNRTEN